jgi:hypothetical protein
MAEKMTEREQIYYGEGYADGYADGRKKLVQSVCDSLSESLYGYNDCKTEYYAGLNDGIKSAMRLMKAEASE